MSVQPVRHFPDSVLRKICDPVFRFDDDLNDRIHDLIATMKHQPYGIGIAAPQIGISKQIAIVDVSARVPGSGRLILINPRILELKQPRANREGCMSLPDYTANLKRYGSVKLTWQDEKAMRHERTFQGIEAVCIQHEVDHLKGVLFIDRVSSLKRDMIPRSKPFKLG